MKVPTVLAGAIQDLSDAAALEYLMQSAVSSVGDPGGDRATLCHALVRYGVAGAYADYQHQPSREAQRSLRALLNLVFHHAAASRVLSNGERQPLGELASTAFYALLALNYREDPTDLPTEGQGRPTG